MLLRTLAPAAFFAAYQLVAPLASAKDSSADQDSGTFECVTGRQEIEDYDAQLLFYNALGTKPSDLPVVTIHARKDEVSVFANTDTGRTTIRIWGQNTTILKYSNQQKSHTITNLIDGHISAFKLELDDRIVTTPILTPMRPDDVRALSDRVLREIDRLCGPRYQS